MHIILEIEGKIIGVKGEGEGHLEQEILSALLKAFLFQHNHHITSFQFIETYLPF